MKKSERIERVINTLNGIDVHGKQNINYMLACIVTLEELMTDCKAEEEGHIVYDTVAAEE